MHPLGPPTYPKTQSRFSNPNDPEPPMELPRGTPSWQDHAVLLFNTMSLKMQCTKSTLFFLEYKPPVRMLICRNSGKPKMRNLSTPKRRAQGCPNDVLERRPHDVMQERQILAQNDGPIFWVYQQAHEIAYSGHLRQWRKCTKSASLICLVNLYFYDYLRKVPFCLVPSSVWSTVIHLFISFNELISFRHPEKRKGIQQPATTLHTRQINVLAFGREALTEAI